LIPVRGPRKSNFRAAPLFPRPSPFSGIPHAEELDGPQFPRNPQKVLITSPRRAPPPKCSKNLGRAQRRVLRFFYLPGVFCPPCPLEFPFLAVFTPCVVDRKNPPPRIIPGFFHSNKRAPEKSRFFGRKKGGTNSPISCFPDFSRSPPPAQTP